MSDRMSLLDVPTGCPDWMSKLSGPTGWMSRLKSCHLLDVPTGCLHRMSLLNVFDRMSSTGCPYWMSRLDVQTQWANWMDVPTKGLSLTGCPYWMSPTSRYFQEFEMGGGGYRQKFWGGGCKRAISTHGPLSFKNIKKQKNDTELWGSSLNWRRGGLYSPLWGWKNITVPIGCPYWMSRLDVPTGCPYRVSRQDVPTECPDWMFRQDVTTACPDRISLLDVPIV